MFRIRIQNKKKCIWYCSAVVSFLLFLLLLGWTNHLANTQDAQQMAGRWSEKGCGTDQLLFSSKAEVTEDTIQSFEYSLKMCCRRPLLQRPQRTPVQDSGWMLTVRTARSPWSTGKYAGCQCHRYRRRLFMFHPLKLITGAYFPVMI